MAQSASDGAASKPTESALADEAPTDASSEQGAPEAQPEAQGTETMEVEEEDATAVEAEVDPQIEAEFRATVSEAISEFNARRWAEARALFLRAHDLQPSARTLRSLGMTSFEMSEYPRAINELSASLGDTRRPLSEEQREQVSSLLSRARLFVGRYDLQLSPEDTAIWVDGVPYTPGNEEFLQLSVGSHELIVRAPGHAELSRRLNVQGGEEQSLELTLTPLAVVATPTVVQTKEPTPATEPQKQFIRPKRLWTWVAAGTSAALGASSAALWLSADSKFNALEKSCNSQCDEADPAITKQADNIDRLQKAHAYTLGFAIATGVGAVTLFFVEPKLGKHRATVGVGPTRVTVGTRF
jgi:hypothetical protein